MWRELRTYVVIGIALFVLGYSVRLGADLSTYLVTFGDYISYAFALLPSLLFLFALFAFLLLAIVAGLGMVRAGFIAITWLLRRRDESTRNFAYVIAWFGLIALLGILFGEQEAPLRYKGIWSDAWARLVERFVSAYQAMGSYQNLTIESFRIERSALGFSYPTLMAIPVLAWYASLVLSVDGKAVLGQASSPANSTPNNPDTTQRDLLARISIMFFACLSAIGMLYGGELRAKLDLENKVLLAACLDSKWAHIRPVLGTERGLILVGEQAELRFLEWDRIREMRSGLPESQFGSACPAPGDIATPPT